MSGASDIGGMSRSDMGFVSFGRYDDFDVSFFVQNEADEIQRHNARGVFYEIAELERIRESTKPNMAILDIGANVGNHTLYFATAMKAKTVIPIEPNPVAYRNLAVNVRLNRLANVDLDFLGVAFGAEEGMITLHIPENNLGAVRVLRNSPGDTKIIRADQVLDGRMFDFVKIDVEALELDVLAGMKGVLSVSHPLLYVEVHDANAKAFERWLKDANYVVSWTHRRYQSNCNFFLHPG